MPGVKPVPWVHVGWDATSRGFELCPKAYCAVPHRKRCLRQGRNAIGKLGRRSYPGLPALVACRAVERRKRLLALRIQYGEDRVRGAVSCPLGKRSERRDAGNGKIARLGQRSRGRDPDSKSREGARPDPHRDPIDAAPSARFFEGGFDRIQEPARVPGPPRLVGLDLALGKCLTRGGDSHRQVRGRGV